jgi:hypothetical protein
MANMVYDLLTVSYQADASIVTAANQYVVVVATTASAKGAPTELDGGAAMPNAQGAAGILGIAQTVPTVALAPVSVRKLGISWAIGHGTINYGDHVAIYSNAGDVYSVEAAIQAAPGTAATFNIVGTAESTVTVNGDLIKIYINPSVVAIAVS